MTMLPSRPRSQQGAAIILAILVVAIVSLLASTMVSEYANSVMQLSGRHDQAQTRWLARGAVDWGRNVLEDDAKNGKTNISDNAREPWATVVPVFAVEEGELSGGIEEQSGRFNINSLVADNGAASLGQVEIFLRLLDNLGIARSQANSLTNDLVDWLDNDDIPYASGSAESSWYAANNRRAPPQAPIVSLDELAAVRGFSSEVLTRLKPYLTALPPQEKRINLNFASPELVAAHIKGLSLMQARTILAGRERAPYTNNRSEFESQLPAGLSAPGELEIKSYYFLVTGRASWGDAATRMEVLLLRDTPRPRIVWQKIL